MSYDLNFWKYSAGVALDHQSVYEKLSDGEVVTGLERIPVEEIRGAVAQEFADGWTQLDENTWESDRGTFQLFTTDQFVRVDCHGMVGDDMNRFIDILHQFDCPLYDPQVGERYDGD